MDLEEIMPDVTMKSGQTEFKERLNHDDTVSWLKTVAGFANAQGVIYSLALEMTIPLRVLPGKKRIRNGIISTIRSMNI